MINIWEFLKGLRIVPKTGTSEADSAGELEVLSSDNKLRYHNGSSTSPVVTETHVATLTNKTLTDPVINGDLTGDSIDTDVELTANSDTKVPSQKAVKAYVDSVDSDLTAEIENRTNADNTLQTNINNEATARAEADTTLQTNIDGKVTKVSSTDNAVTRFNGDTGELQNSAIKITDSGEIQSITGDLPLRAEGLNAVKVESNLEAAGSEIYGTKIPSPLTTTGANSNLVIDPGKHIRVTSADITGIDTIEAQNGGVTAVADGQEITLINVTGAELTLNNETGSSTGKQITTGTGGAITLLQGHAVKLVYSSVESKWVVVGSVFKGPSFSTDNSIPVFDGANGDKVKSSTATIDTDGKLTVSSISTDGEIAPISNVAVQIAGINNTGVLFHEITEDATIGDNVAIDATESKVIVLNGVGLNSIDAIISQADGQEITLVNNSGNDISLTNEATVSEGSKIFTGTGSDITLKDNASITLVLSGGNDGWVVVGGTGSGGGQTPETFVQLTGEEKITDWTTGNNATFLGGGTAFGSLLKDDTTPLNGDASYTYTQNVGSANDYLASPVQAVPRRFRGRSVLVTFPYIYNGNAGDISLVAYDVTNSAIITQSSVTTLNATGTTVTAFNTTITIPSNCTEIRMGFQTNVENNAKILQFDDIELKEIPSFYTSVQQGIVGEVITHAGESTPVGFLACDGSAISRSIYWELFDAIGITHGQGDGSTTFNLPDYRGQFLRGKIDLNSITGSGTVASNQATFTSHGINRTGMKVRLISGTLTGLTASTTDYYAIVIDENTLSFATTLANALAGTAIAISGTNTGVISQWEDPDSSTREANAVGGNSGSSVGSHQEDAIRNLTGYFGMTDDNSTDMRVRVKEATGAFYAQNITENYVNSNSVPGNTTVAGRVQFDASRQSPTGNDIRPKNVYVNFYIRYTSSGTTSIVESGDKNTIGETIFSINPTTPKNFVSADNKTIGILSADYSGTAYYSLYEHIWGLAGLSTTVGHPFVISTTKGATAAEDWSAGKLITVDFTTNEVFIRSKGATATPGTYQTSQNLSHTHRAYGAGGGVELFTASSSRGFMGADTASGYDQTTGAGVNYIESSGGTEARPKNVAMYTYIRYKEDSITASLSDIDYIYMEAAGNIGQTVTSSVTDVPFIPTDDVLNLWSGDSFEVPLNGLYSIIGMIYIAGSGVARGVELYIDGVRIRRISDYEDLSGAVSFRYTGKFTKNQVISFRIVGTAGDLGTLTEYHWLTIARIPGQFR